MRKRVKELKKRLGRLNQKILRKVREPGTVRDIGLWDGASDSKFRQIVLTKTQLFPLSFLKVSSHHPPSLAFSFLKSDSFRATNFAFSFLTGIAFRCGRLSFQFETLQFLVTLSSTVKYNPEKEIFGLSDEVEVNLNP